MRLRGFIVQFFLEEGPGASNLARPGQKNAFTALGLELPKSEEMSCLNGSWIWGVELDFPTHLVDPTLCL